MKKYPLMAFAAVACLFTSQAFAQTRTWVSGNGNDANPCSLTAPCKTFAGALLKTAAGGEISALDPGGYGAVTIDQSITITGDGTLAGILSTGLNQAILVNAGPTDVVIIRNVSIHGAGTGVNAIRFIAGGELHVENVAMYGFSGQGILFAPAAASGLFVSNSSIRNANGGAVLVQPTGIGTAVASINGVTMDGNGRGLRAEDGATVIVRNSQATGNVANGFVAIGTTRPVDLTLENVVSAGNGATGVYAGALSSISLSNTLVRRNNAGLQAVGGGTITSFGNNRVSGNTINNGPPSAIVPQM